MTGSRCGARVALLLFGTLLAGCDRREGPPRFPPPGGGEHHHPPGESDTRPSPQPSLPPGEIAALRENALHYPQPGEWVVRHPSNWAKLFVTRSSGTGFVETSADSGAPRVDFTREMVLAVSLGIKNTGGYSVSIGRIGYDRSLAKIVARVEIRVPGAGDMVTQGLSVPGHSVVIPRYDVPVVFQRFIERGGLGPAPQSSSPAPDPVSVIPSGTPSLPPLPPPSSDTGGDLDFQVNGGTRSNGSNADAQSAAPRSQPD